MHGLLGLQLPDGDPYEVPEVPREVVKAWLTATLGKGSPVKRWPEKTAREKPEIVALPASQVSSAIIARYPFLGDPARTVAESAKLTSLASLGRLPKLLTPRLMHIEAEALTRAMETMRSRDILALPLHDSLILPRSGVPYVAEALVSAFREFARVHVRIKLVGDQNGMPLE
jgi:hypothetical protein